MKRAKKQLLVPALVALTLATSVSLAASGSVSAESGNHMQMPKFAMQCDHPGFAHFGFHSRGDCMGFVNKHPHQPGDGGKGYGYNGGGGGHNTITNTIGDVFSHIGNITNSVVNVTINFVTNIFH